MEEKHIMIESAVSPVIGVMLMLVVTIIIAAVVSAFAGGIGSDQQKAPGISGQIVIENTGDSSSRFDIRVESVSEPIPSKDLKIVTSWTKKDSTGTIITGGNTTLPNVALNNYGTTLRVQPYGYGSGVTSWGAYGTPTPDQQFGNYTLTGGTSMHSTVYGRNAAGGGYGVSTPYTYTNGSSYTLYKHTDGLQHNLGYNWYLLRAGDVVNVKLVHIPSGKTIFEKDVVVSERV